MPFALTNDPSQSEISEAINYLLANFGANLSVDPNNGQITGSSGVVIAYFYKYLAVKYADSYDGTVNFSNSPTNRTYYGLRNTDSSVESTNPADYIWYQATGGFGTTKFLFYQTGGGRQINFVVATAAPDSSYVIDSGSAIDLDVVTASTANAAAAAAQATANAAQATANAAYSGLGDKLNKYAADILYGPIDFTSGGGFKTDNINIDSSGNATGYGVAITSKGLVGRNTSATTFTINASTGDANFAGDINTDGDALFYGLNATTTYKIKVNGVLYPIDYSAFGQASSTPNAGSVRVGLLGSADSTSSTSTWNVGVVGYGKTVSSANSIGVVGQGDSFGGYFSTDGASSVGLLAVNTNPAGAALWIESGTFRWGGYFIQPPDSNSSHFLNGQGQWVTPSSSGMTTAVTNSGSATVSGGSLSILGSTSTGIAGAYVGTTGSGSTVTLDVRTTSPSDVRLKEEIADADVGLDFVKQLRPVSYKLKADPRHQKGYGFIAQEVEALVGDQSSLVYEEPNWQVGDEIGFKTIHYPSYIAVLTKAIQELSAKVEALEAQIKA